MTNLLDYKHESGYYQLGDYLYDIDGEYIMEVAEWNLENNQDEPE